MLNDNVHSRGVKGIRTAVPGGLFINVHYQDARSLFRIIRARS